MVFTQVGCFVVGHRLVCHAADTASLATWFLFGKLIAVATLCRLSGFVRSSVVGTFHCATYDMTDKDHYEPKNRREVALMLTALLPIYVASRIASSIPQVAAFPNWLNEIVDFACWALICIVLVHAWARFLHFLRLLDDDQLSRYPFGLGSGRN